MALTNEVIQQALTAQFGEQLTEWEAPFGLLTFRAPAEMNLKVMQFLFDSKELGFTFLTDLTAVHFPEREGEEICVVYHVQNMRVGARLRMKIYVPVAKPDVFTATQLHAGANWMERETYDFFGVNFIGHPNLTRILNVDEMDYFPLRKEYEMEDPTRRDKDDDMFGR
jgi:NADH-quinone oxidoreductase subunit C